MAPAFGQTAWYSNQPDGYVIVNGDTLFHYKGEIPNGGVIDDFPAQIKKIAGSAFSYDPAHLFSSTATNLVSIEIPDGVQLADESIFSDCKSLQHVRLPGDLTVIPKETFSGCIALESIEIPQSVEVIEESAFLRCKNLQSITLHEGITTIGKFAFSNCESLTKLYFPDSIKTADFTTLPSALKEVILPVTMNNVTWFGANTVVYYRGSEERWQTDFPNVRGGIWYFYVENEADLPADGGNYWHFAPDGKTPLAW